MTDRHPVWQLLDRIQMDAKALDSKVSELRREMVAFELKAESGSALVCDVCGIGAGLHAEGCPEAPAVVEVVGAARRDPPPWINEDPPVRVPVTDERTAK